VAVSIDNLINVDLTKGTTDLLRFGLNLGGSGQHKPYIFTPADLFFLGEQGAWYNPIDITTLFQNAEGTTPVTADGDPVGRMRDKSPNLNLAVIWTPFQLFKNSQMGSWYEPIDITTLFQDVEGTIPVTADGDPAARNNDKSGNGRNAVQTISSRRPVYNVDPSRLLYDKVDDALIITVPTGGWVGTMVLATDQGTASYGVSIPAGNYTLGGQNLPGHSIVGAVFRDGEMTAGEKTDTESYFVGNGATASYGAISDFANFWNGHSEITEFPLIDTSSGTNFGLAWRDCTSLTSFPLIDTSSGANFGLAWYKCSSLTSFPLIDTSSGTDFNQAWHTCSSLTSFPLIDTSSGTDFYAAWYKCSSLTSFPLIDTSSGTDFNRAWRTCSSLTSFPLIDTSSGTDFSYTWANCSSLTSFPANAFDNIKGGDFAGAFFSTALDQTSIDGILVSLVTSGITAGAFDQSGGSAPSVDTGQPAIDTLRSRGWTVSVEGGY
jgi:hypothetical protein